MKSRKYFNLVLPVEVYRELKKTAFETDQSIAKLVRHGIDIVLGKQQISEDTKSTGN